MYMNRHIRYTKYGNMWHLIERIFVIATMVGHSTSLSTGQYKSYSIKKENWHKISDKPSDAKTYGRSVELCSWACREVFSDNPAEGCEAFTISDQGKCEFGIIQADECLRVVGENETSSIQVFADTKKYILSKVYELHVVNHDEEPVTHIQTMPRDLGCSPTIKVPRTGVRYKETQPPIVINLDRGLLSCGGVDHSSGDRIRECKYWRPGQASWQDMPALKDDHDVGSCGTSLGPNEAFIVAKKYNSKVAEILSNNAWNLVAEFPLEVQKCYAFAKTPNVIYVMGGGLHGEEGDKAYSYKYERPLNRWTKMPGLIYGTQILSCARTHYNGLDTLLCVGGTDLGQTGKAQYFDLEKETWHDEGEQFAGMENMPKGASRTNVAIGNLFYRAREDELLIWNLKTGDWTEEPSLPQELEAIIPSFKHCFL